MRDFAAGLGGRIQGFGAGVYGWGRRRYHNALNFGAEATGGYLSGLDAMANAMPHFTRLGYMADPSLRGVARGFATGARRLFYDNFTRMPTVGGAAGYGAALASPLLAGAAIYSGLANLRRGRYGRAALGLAAGAGIVGMMYAGAMRNVAGARQQRAWQDYDDFRRQADFDL